jgi:hypothetical protein
MSDIITHYSILVDGKKKTPSCFDVGGLRFNRIKVGMSLLKYTIISDVFNEIPNDTYITSFVEIMLGIFLREIEVEIDLNSKTDKINSIKIKFFGEKDLVVYTNEEMTEFYSRKKKYTKKSLAREISNQVLNYQLNHLLKI